MRLGLFAATTVMCGSGRSGTPQWSVGIDRPTNKTVLRLESPALICFRGACCFADLILAIVADIFSGVMINVGPRG